MRIRALILSMIVLSVVGYLRSSAPAHANRLQNVPTPSSTPDLVMTQVRKANTLTKADTAYMRAGDLTTPSLIPLDNIMQVAAGASHTCVLTTIGSVLCWGDNENGQLGDGTTKDRSTPRAVSGLQSGVSAISAGGGHTCAVTTAGGVLCWGYNWASQLGDGTTTDRSTPVAVSGLQSGIHTVSAGAAQTCAVTTTGGVLCWGAYGLDWWSSTGSYSSTPMAVSGLQSGVSAVSAGSYKTCAVTTAGSALCWGYNRPYSDLTF